MERFFNTAGPIKPELHYNIDPLKRFDLEELLLLVRQQKYFVLHAPRQTGKTSCLLALRDYLNARDEFVAVYANVEGGQALRNDVEGVVSGVCSVIAGAFDSVMNTKRYSALALENDQVPASNRLSSFLTLLSEDVQKPIVLFIDEIDALVGDSLVSVLRQIRSGYASRPQQFPQSIVLCGVRDVRDYRIVLSNQDIVAGGSAFNIKAESLRLGNFSKEEIRELYLEHTKATGQEFDEACFPMVWEATEGQPWLVNALGYEVTMKMKENRDRSIRIIPEMIYRAQERIIYRRDTHIDILIDKLKEERVRRVIEPILSSTDEADESLIPSDDIQYVVDMGLIKREKGKPIRVANGIYREIIPRELTWTTQESLVQQSAWYINDDNSINMEKLLLDFQQFFRQNADAWIEKFDYKEGRTDLLIRKPLTDHYGGPIQRIVLELKIKRNRIEKTINDGLRQTWEYMDKAGAIDEGHFIIFDRTPGKPWEEKIWHEEREYEGRKIMVWGM